MGKLALFNGALHVFGWKWWKYVAVRGENILNVGCAVE